MRLACRLSILMLLWAAALAAEPVVDDFMTGIVRLQADVPAAAPSAGTLGTERLGTAILIGGDGLLVTMAYLVRHAAQVQLQFSNGQTAVARVVAEDVSNGLALLRAVTPDGALALRIGSSSRLAPGQRLVAVDYRGSDHAAAVQMVSRAPFYGSAEYYLRDPLRTTPLRRSFSGAALLDADARLLGIGAFGLAAIEGQSSPAGNLFVPIDDLTAALAQMLINGHSDAAIRPWLGLAIDADDMTVSEVRPHGPARIADIHVGDEIIAIDNYRVPSLADLYRRLWTEVDIGQSVELLLARSGQLVTTTIKTISAVEQIECEIC